MLGQQLWFGLELGAVYVLVALGLSLLFGVMRVINFAHGELCMLGSMVLYTLMNKLAFPFFLAAVLSISFVAAFGLVVNRIAVRPLIVKSPLSVILSTLALSFILLHGANSVWGPVARHIEAPFGGQLQVGNVSVSGHGIMLLVVVMSAVTGLHLFLSRTRIGKLIRATSQDMTGAKIVGINVNRVFDFSMVLASAIAALGGIFVFPVLSTFPSMGQSLIIVAFVVVIVGGMGSIKGCVVVGFLIGILEAVFGHFFSMLYRPVFVYGIMMIALLFRPKGMFGQKG